MPPFPVARLTVDDYHRMIETNVLTTADRLELLDGWLVPKVTQNPPHAARVDEMTERLFVRCLETRWKVRCQLPITLADSEPEPDASIVRRDSYHTRHPLAVDVLVVIEVAVSSLRDDRVRKARVYAGGNVARYLIVNLPDRQVELLSDPDPQRQLYRSQTVVTGPTIDLDGLELSLGDLLGAA